LILRASRDPALQMWPIEFEKLSPAVNGAILAGAAVLMWLAGTRLSRHAEAVAVRTGLGQAFVGMILLGVAAS
jgi:cation:H+ antiporter